MYFHLNKNQVFVCSLVVLSLISRGSCSLWAMDMLSNSRMPLQSYSKENHQEEQGRKCYKGQIYSKLKSRIIKTQSFRNYR